MTVIKSVKNIQKIFWKPWYSSGNFVWPKFSVILILNLTINLTLEPKPHSTLLPKPNSTPNPDPHYKVKNIFTI